MRLFHKGERMSRGTSISKYYKSFSGTDTIAFMIFPGINPIVIGSLTTISYSMYRNKVPVINIGRTNINGITRGSRIYAGTMVFTLINKHWLRELQEKADYLADFPTLKTDELPLFDIMIVSANEYGSSCSMFIYGIDFTDEAQTLSIEDLFTENIFKFVAREVSVFDENIINVSEPKYQKQYYKVNTGILKNYYENAIQKNEQQNLNQNAEIRPLNRTLYLVTNKEPFIGEDVAAIQQLLNLALPESNIAITYRFDRLTDSAVRNFQSQNGLIVDGVVDNTTYTKLLENVKENKKGSYIQIINKSGAYVYKNADVNSTIIQIFPYLSSIETYEKMSVENGTFYRTKEGYVSIYDCFDYSLVNEYEYKTLKYGDQNQQVLVLQNILKELYPNFNEYTPGLFDEETENYLKKFQLDHELLHNGICEYNTWNELLNATDENYKHYLSNHAEIHTSLEPAVYTINDLNQLSDFTVTINNNNTNQVKYSVISVYKNKKTKTKSKTLTFNDEETHSVNEFVNMFKDDINYLTPTDVYYIVYPYGSTPYKWHFKVDLT